MLCDTNGGMLPARLCDVVGEVLGGSGARLGIHCHDDTACAVANTLAAVDAGVTHVQGTANGFGERAGNADLFSVVAGLETKMSRPVLPEGRLAELVRVSHAINEVANVTPDPHRPYVGLSAFAHKAGLHASAIKVDPSLYQHMDPALVGNDMRMLVSELAGRATIELKGREMGLDLSGDRAALGRVVDRVKEMEARGYVFEAAEASFELLLREEFEGRHGTSRSSRGGSSSKSGPTVPWSARPPSSCTPAASGSWPPARATVPSTRLTGRCEQPSKRPTPVWQPSISWTTRSASSKARWPVPARSDRHGLDAGHGTDAVTRVLVETSDGTTEWTTVGVHENVVEASWQALEDAVTYGLLRQGERPEQ